MHESGIGELETWLSHERLGSQPNISENEIGSGTANTIAFGFIKLRDKFISGALAKTID